MDYCCVAHSHWEPYTNRAWLRSLSDEELAKFLCDHSGCISEKCIGVSECCVGGNGIERWLKKQVEVDAE